MELVIKHFGGLTLEELYDIKKYARTFCGEAKTPLPRDRRQGQGRVSFFMRGEQGAAAYLRVLKSGVSFPEPSAWADSHNAARRGLGTKTVREGIKFAEEKLGAKKTE